MIQKPKRNYILIRNLFDLISVGKRNYGNFLPWKNIRKENKLLFSNEVGNYFSHLLSILQQLFFFIVSPCLETTFPFTRLNYRKFYFKSICCFSVIIALQISQEGKERREKSFIELGKKAEGVTEWWKVFSSLLIVIKEQFTLIDWVTFCEIKTIQFWVSVDFKFEKKKVWDCF